MDVKLPAGKYVVAVSGGVDSIVLLDLLRRDSELELLVAHFDHGIRSDSADDKNFVAGLAQLYGLPFICAEGRLGHDVSEAVARQARYQFLQKTKQDNSADAIVTAHHQDDLLETAVINLMRGTGRRGLSSLKSTDDIRRPLLGFSKQQIRDWALKNRLEWQEDSTNYSDDYLRNRVRHNILPKLDKLKLLSLVTREAQLNLGIDEILDQLLSEVGGSMDRRWFAGLDSVVGLEVMAAWLRKNGFTDYNRKMLRRFDEAARTGRNGNRYDISGELWLHVGRVDIKIAPKV